MIAPRPSATGESRPLPAPRIWNQALCVWSRGLGRSGADSGVVVSLA
ncbi:MAG: hypothetical protein HY744_20120 [Deltaproteobacteria bacterium]|nr:hypothetical protein [Deltaproteobacteria bacterium]